MNDHKDVEKVQLALDTTFSNLKDDPWLAQKVLANAKGETKMKKKLSIGLVLVIVMVLLAAGAVAAVLLSMQQLVEDKAIPMANQYEGEAYTIKDTNILLQLAQNNGIELSDETKAKIEDALEQGEGYFKEEMLMALAKAEFGASYATWSIEQQKWFDDVCIAIGFVSTPQHSLPDEDVLTQHEIENISIMYINEHFNPKSDLNDQVHYTKTTQYLNGLNDGEYDGNYWSIAYEAIDVDDSTYWIYLDDLGRVFNAIEIPGLAEGASVEQIFDRYSELYGWFFGTWEHKAIQSLHDAIMHAASTYLESYACISQTEYPDIAPNAMTREQAEQIAIAELHITAEEYEGVVKPLGAVYIADSPNPIWKVRIYTELPGGNMENDRLNSIATYFVEVDSITGDIKSTYQMDNHSDRLFIQLVLQKTIEKVEADWVDRSPATPIPVG